MLITFLDETVEKADNEFKVDPIKALRGCTKGLKLTEKLLESRREDLELEEAKLGKDKSINKNKNQKVWNEFIDLSDAVSEQWKGTSAVEEIKLQRRK